MTSAKAPRGRRLSAEARQMLPWCIALAVAGHVLLLAAVAPSPRGSGAQAGGRPARTVSVRLIPPGSTALRAETTTASAAAAMPSAPTSAASMASNDVTAAESSPPAALVPSAPAAGSGSLAAVASEGASAASKGTEPGEGGYVPRPLLTVAPEPVIPVVIAPPPATAGGHLIGRYRGVLALYIDETGRVRRVEPESPTLPEPMERAARDAFLGARFSAGQVGGRVVKSRIRVEVVFDDAPPPLAAASAASAASRAGEAASAVSSVQRVP